MGFISLAVELENRLVIKRQHYPKNGLGAVIVTMTVNELTLNEAGPWDAIHR